MDRARLILGTVRVRPGVRETWFHPVEEDDKTHCLFHVA